MHVDTTQKQTVDLNPHSPCSFFPWPDCSGIFLYRITIYWNRKRLRKSEHFTLVLQTHKKVCRWKVCCYKDLIATANHSGWAFYREGLRPIACWDCDFISRWGVWVSISCECCLCCQVEVSMTGRSLVQRNLTDCVASLWKPQEWGGRGPRWAVAPQKKVAQVNNNKRYNTLSYSIGRP
jgi:hypothetical protein